METNKTTCPGCGLFCIGEDNQFSCVSDSCAVKRFGVHRDGAKVLVELAQGVPVVTLPPRALAVDAIALIIPAKKYRGEREW